MDILDVVFVVFLVVVVVLFIVVVLLVVVLSVVLFVVVVVLLVAVLADVEVVLVADDEVLSVVVLCVVDFVKICVLLVLLSVAVTVLFVDDVGVLLIIVLLSSVVLSCDVLSSGVLIFEMVNVLLLSDPKEFVLPMCKLCAFFADMSTMFSWLKEGMILKVSSDVTPRSGVSFEWLLPVGEIGQFSLVWYF